MSQYADPDNIEEIKEEIKNCATIFEVSTVINKHIPGWIVAYLNGYSDDYPHLTENWKKLCMLVDGSPETSQVMIVDELINDSNHKMINLFAELFTRCGFSLKRKMDFIPCSVCNKALPTEVVYNQFAKQKFIIPEEYNEKCVNC